MHPLSLGMRIGIVGVSAAGIGTMAHLAGESHDGYISRSNTIGRAKDSFAIPAMATMAVVGLGLLATRGAAKSWTPEVIQEIADARQTGAWVTDATYKAYRLNAYDSAFAHLALGGVGGAVIGAASSFMDDLNIGFDHF